MPDGAAFPSRFFSAYEISAHCEILDALRDHADNAIGERTMQLRVQRACDQFMPRCPACSGLLNRKQAIGLVVLSCVCGWSCKEAV